MKTTSPVRLSLITALVLSLTGANLSAQAKLALKDGVAEADGKITKKDPLDKERKQPCKLYAISLKEGQSYQIDMMENKDGIDPYLRVVDSTGKELAKDDDGGDGLNARIVLRAPRGGVYTIVATTFKGGTGSFKLKVAELKLAKAGELALKDGKVSVLSEIADGDPGDAVRKQPCRIFTVKLLAGKTYQIDMMKKSPGLDPYLRLEDSTGKELAKDDDGGDGLNARINFACPKEDTYRIICTTFNGGSGVYELKVAEK